MKMQNNNLTLEELRDLCDKLIAAKSPHTVTNILGIIPECQNTLMSMDFDTNQHEKIRELAEEVPQRAKDAKKEVWNVVCQRRTDMKAHIKKMEDALKVFGKRVCDPANIDFYAEADEAFAAMRDMEETMKGLEFWAEDFDAGSYSLAELFEDYE